MRLEKAEVSSFRSVHHSNEFALGDITCFVGKNEAGKTALLQALYRLNPILPEHATFDVIYDYPKSEVEDYRQAVEAGSQQPAVVINATFNLDEHELSPIREKFGPAAMPGSTFTVGKGYGNKFLVGLPTDEPNVIKHLLKEAKLPKTAQEELAVDSFKELAELLEQRGGEQKQAYDAAMAKANASNDPKSKAKAAAQAKQYAAQPSVSLLAKMAVEVSKDGPLWHHLWLRYVHPRLPKFLYFDEYYQMAGATNIEKLQERQASQGLEPSDLPMLGLIDLARLNLSELIAPKQTMELINKLQGASNHLSRQVLKYWSQNKHIRLQFDVRDALAGDPSGMRQGTNLWGFVYDDVHLVSTPLGSRSRGFVWFFSFLAWYSQQKKTNQSIILLLDEPGLSLHASAQADFLRFVEEELKPHHQVIYTTHSPFLVDAKHFDRVRTVEDKSMMSDETLPDSERGTKVSQDVLAVTKGTLFPLQGALGYELAQPLFIGPNSLIVEGVSDLLYIQSISGLLESQGRTGLRKEWTITPVGGAEKVPTFASLIGTQPGMNVATLIDIQKRDQQQIENLYKRRLLQQSHVFTYADFTATNEADIEDMFEPDFYLSLVNTEYKKVIGTPLQASDLKPGGSRILPRIEAVLQLRGVGHQFNHYRPARYFAEQVGALAAGLSATVLDRFEAAFLALNKLL